MWNPTENWLPSSSFVEPVAIPDAAPGDSPGVSVCFNASWLPYVIGGLMQLIQPTTWATSDPGALQAVLDNVADLINQFGTAGGCMQLRWSPDDCAIEQSTDNGETWTPIDGWDLTSVQGCVMGGLSIRIDAGGNLQWSIDGGDTWSSVDGWAPGEPPNPSGAVNEQEACNIAQHLAQNIIQGALAKAVSSFDASVEVAVAAASVVALIPVFGPEVALTIDAAAGLVYLIYNTGSIGDYRTASTDPVLALDIQCAIYNVIKADGFVTAANYASVVTAINGIGYTPSDVQTAINNFVGSLGLNGMLAAQQLGGTVLGDCSSCGGTPLPGGNVLSFNGTNDYLSQSNIIKRDSTQNFTWCAWIKPAAIGNPSPLWWSLNTDDANGEFYVALGLASPHGKPTWGQFEGAGTTLGYIQDNTGAATAGTWVHVAVTIDASTGPDTTGVMYINGSSVSATRTQAVGFGDSGFTGGTKLGNDPRNPTIWYSGEMADIRMYTTKLTSTQLAAITAGGPTGMVVEGSPIHWWPGNEGAGTSAADWGSATHRPLTWHGSGGHWGAP